MATDKELADRAQLSLRFDERLRRQIEDAAGRSLRSMNSEIIWRLKSSFEQSSDDVAT